MNARQWVLVVAALVMALVLAFQPCVVTSYDGLHPPSFRWISVVAAVVSSDVQRLPTIWYGEMLGVAWLTWAALRFVDERGRTQRVPVMTVRLISTLLWAAAVVMFVVGFAGGLGPLSSVGSFVAGGALLALWVSLLALRRAHETWEAAPLDGREQKE